MTSFARFCDWFYKVLYGIVIIYAFNVLLVFGLNFLDTITGTNPPHTPPPYLTEHNLIAAVRDGYGFGIQEIIVFDCWSAVPLFAAAVIFARNRAVRKLAVLAVAAAISFLPALWCHMVYLPATVGAEYAIGEANYIWGLGFIVASAVGYGLLLIGLLLRKHAAPANTMNPKNPSDAS